MVGFQKLKCVSLNNFYVCGPISMKLIPHLVFKVRKAYWQNGGQGPITLGDLSLHMFSNFAILENFRNKCLRTYEPKKAESSYKHAEIEAKGPYLLEL